MEFYELVETRLDEQALQGIAIQHLPDFCASIDKVLEQQGDRGRVYCCWGEFTVHRECVNGGVRFTLPACPNNLAWTITRGIEPGPAYVMIHLTISPQHHDLEFIDSIHTFVADWKHGLESHSAEQFQLHPKEVVTE